MGCFSFMCKECGTSVKSSSFRGQETHLFLLKNGKIIQRMEGEYDSYGRVFIPNSQVENVKHDLMESIKWNAPEEGVEEWEDVCGLMFDPNPSNGIAAIHLKCFKENEPLPTTRSEDDPDQGWGDDWEYFGETSVNKEIE